MFRALVLTVVTAMALTAGTAFAGPCAASIKRVEKSMGRAAPGKQQVAQKYIDQAKVAAQAGNNKQCKAAVKHAKSALQAKVAKKPAKTARAAKPAKHPG